MSSKLKKWIIVVVVFLLVCVGVLVGFSVLSKLSTTTIHDLRLIDANSREEIFEKEVYLTATEQNYFDVDVYASASTITSYAVNSSDKSVATVSVVDGVVRINYLKAGTTIITANCVDGGDISDNFTLNVKENVPTSFSITDENAISETEVSIFADDRDYSFDFKALQGSNENNINLTSIKVLSNYNAEVFEDIYIDDANSKLVIKAKQSGLDTREYITLQSYYTDVNGNQITVGTFVVCVNVKGNYISDIQLMLSGVADFDNSVNIYGSGIKNEGEREINTVFLTDEVDTVYAKVRVVYTNGQMFDVTKNVISQTMSGTPTTIKPAVGDYYSISVKNSGSATIRFAYSQYYVVLLFNYINETTTPETYNNFINNQLYRKIEVDGTTYYEYIYWDTRFMREDTITDGKGIIGFTGEYPTCGE